MVEDPPHGELEKLTEVGHMERGIGLYRCRRCASWWELDAWTYFPQRSSVRRVRPVASLEKWAAKKRRALRPRPLLVACSLVFGAGCLAIAMFVGIGWLVKTLFSFEAAHWVLFVLMLGCLFLLYRSAQARETPGRS